MCYQSEQALYFIFRVSHLSLALFTSKTSGYWITHLFSLHLKKCIFSQSPKHMSESLRLCSFSTTNFAKFSIPSIIITTSVSHCLLLVQIMSRVPIKSVAFKDLSKWSTFDKIKLFHVSRWEFGILALCQFYHPTSKILVIFLHNLFLCTLLSSSKYSHHASSLIFKIVSLDKIFI